MLVRTPDRNRAYAWAALWWLLAIGLMLLRHSWRLDVDGLDVGLIQVAMLGYTDLTLRRPQWRWPILIGALSDLYLAAITLPVLRVWG